MSFIASNIHAIQWYGGEGSVEYRDDRGFVTHNVVINSLEMFEPTVVAWQQAKLAFEQARIDAIEQALLAKKQMELDELEQKSEPDESDVAISAPDNATE